jgi:chloramphenicol 3-O-phosphotransferase
MYFGSDDEKAITKSIQDAFPSATVHVQMTGFLTSFASHSTDKGQGILSSPPLPL